MRSPLSSDKALGLLSGTGSRQATTESLHENFSSENVQFTDASRQLGIERVTMDSGLLGHVGYGDYTMSIAKVDPLALGADFPFKKDFSDQDGPIGASDGGITVVGHRDGSEVRQVDFSCTADDEINLNRMNFTEI